MSVLLPLVGFLALLVVGCLLERHPWFIAAVERDEARLDGER